MQLAHLEVWRGEQQIGHVHLSPGLPLEVGREGAGCRVADPAMSRRHFAVVQGEGGWFVEDLGSSGGTFLNDRSVAGPMLLSAGDRIEAGETVFVVDIEEASLDHIEGTHWHIKRLPAGFFVIRHLGLQREGSSSFAETVVCREDELRDALSLSVYAERQLEQLGLFASDLHVMPTLSPKAAGEEGPVLRRLSFTYQGKPLHQWHCYVQGIHRVGILVWTFEQTHETEPEELGQILDALVFND